MLHERCVEWGKERNNDHVLGIVVLASVVPKQYCSTIW